MKPRIEKEKVDPKKMHEERPNNNSIFGFLLPDNGK